MASENVDGTWQTSNQDRNVETARCWRWQVLVGAPYDKSELGATWCDFAPRFNRGIQERFMDAEKDFRYGRVGTLYVIDFSSAKQINVRTNKAHDIRRSWIAFLYLEPTYQQWVPPPPKGGGKGRNRR